LEVQKKYRKRFGSEVVFGSRGQHPATGIVVGVEEVFEV